MVNSGELPTRIVIQPTAWDDVGAAALRDEQQRELRAVYGGDVEPGVKPSAADVAVFLVAYERPVDPSPAVGCGDAVGGSDAAGRGDAVGCGGLRPLGADTAEIKRMYVRPSHRGAGLSRVILQELELQASRRGWQHLALETGPLQTAAIALYRSAGYRPIPRFGHYVDSTTSLCFGKTLRSGHL